MLSRSELHEKAPYISTTMVGAAFCPIEGKANPLVVAPAFADAARRYGAVISTKTEVLEIEKSSQGFTISTSAGQFRGAKVLITANAGIPKLTAGLGKRIPISDVPVQVSVTEQIEKFVHHLVYFTSEKLTFKQANSGSLLIGGGWPARYDEKQNPILNPDSLRSNLRVALKVVPRIADVKVIRTWVGTGNGTEDHNPIIDKFPGVDNLYVGMYPYMGFTASPLMGKLLAELILTGKCQRDISPFTIERLI
jgi:glycine/D-amino acid oxidase-like deaminating enzyme